MALFEYYCNHCDRWSKFDTAKGQQDLHENCGKEKK